MVARQKIRAGIVHTGKTATVICENSHFLVVIDGETVVPRIITSEVHHYKANATDTRSSPGFSRNDGDPSRRSSFCAASTAGSFSMESAGHTPAGFLGTASIRARRRTDLEHRRWRLRRR